MQDSEHEDDNPVERYQKLGFQPQKELPWNKYLPYADKLDDESQKMLFDVKANLAKAIAMSDIKPGVGICASGLSLYMKLYGLKFSKEDHIQFVKIFVDLLCLEDLEPRELIRICIVINNLLQKPYILSPDDLQIEWKPLYRIFEIYLHNTSNKGNFYQYFSKREKFKNENKNTMSFMFSVIDQMFPLAKFLGGTLNSFENVVDLDIDNKTDRLQSRLKTVIAKCSIYFPKSSTKEILDEILPKLQPLETGKSCQIFEIMNLFLNFRNGYELWLDDFMDIWNTYYNPPWNEDIMNIMGNVAYENIGKIDWEPHIPVMFARILRWIDLPVNYKHLKISKSAVFNSTSVAKWIVAVLGPNTSGQKYLTKFIGAIESYLHPANNGKWIKNLGQILVALPELFLNRLEYERYRKPKWMDPVPDSHKLTEKCITDFVESLKSAAFQTMYSRIDMNDVHNIFRYLSNLRPELIIPEVIDRVYSNSESLTEPHRLTASLQCLVGISRALISGHNGYTAGRVHIIPILFAILPGIDPNDIRKTLLTISFYCVFLLQISIVDCSKAGQFYNNLTEEEALICEQTADFEDFVLQFIDRLFLMTKFTAQESIRMEQTDSESSKSKIDRVVEDTFFNGLKVILGQCSEEILQSAAKKIIDFVQNNVLEPLTAAPLLGNLVTSIALETGNHTLKTLVPYLTDKILRYIREHDDAAVAKIEKQSDEFLYHLTILFSLYKGDPTEAINYVDDYLIPVLDEVIHFKCMNTSKITASFLVNFMENLSKPLILDKSLNKNLKKLSPEYLPIRHWGEKMKHNETFDWHVPGEKERLVGEKILHRYLPNIIEKFEMYSNGELEMERNEILRNLNLTLSLINIPCFLPNWNEPQKKLTDTVVDFSHWKPILGIENSGIHMPDGSNIRFTIINTISRLQDKILKDSSDDIKSITVIISLWDRICTYRRFENSFDIEMKLYNHFKQFQVYNLVKKKRSMREIVSRRVLIQQTCRDELNSMHFTQTHSEILKKLLQLATSYYSSVRILAQMKMSKMTQNYGLAYLDILDDLVKYLELDSTVHHESYKGALFVVIGATNTRMIVKNDWQCIKKLWIAVLKSKPSEKPSIVHLLDAIIYIINNEFTTTTIEIQNSDKLIQSALNLVKSDATESCFITDKDIEEGKKKLEKLNRENVECYLSLLNAILDITKNNNLHWRYHFMATTMIHTLVHPKIKYPLNVAEYVVKNLINDSIKERKMATGTLVSILEQQKRKNIRIDIDPFEIAGIKRTTEKLPFGTRDDNRWLQYNHETLPNSQDDWDKSFFLHKPDGFFGWSNDLKIYAPNSQQPNIDRTRDDMNPIEQIIYDFFSDKDNLRKCISFWSLEEVKGKEKFKEMRFSLIKYLFKNYGDMFLDDFLPYIEKLIKENNVESNHRSAAEMLSGIMRGMKHWPYENTKNAYEKIIPLVRLALENVTTETDEFWGTCFATASEHIDPRKQHWLYEVLIEDPFRESTSFIDCCRIFCLQGPFNQHVWRMDSYAHRLLNYLRPYLSHQFQNVRIRLGSILINIFEADLQFKNGNPPKCPRVADMIAEVVEKFKPLNQDMPVKLTSSKEGNLDVKASEEQHKYEEAVRLYKTICQWIIGVIARNTNGNEVSYFDLLPFACRFESCEQDAELAEVSTTLLAIISQALTLPDQMAYALKKINEISKSSSWNSRLAVIDTLQVLVFHNMAIVLSRSDWVQEVQNIVLRLLEDTSVEVREKASQVLGGLLHCSFLPATDKLLEQFKRKCKTKVVRKIGNQRGMNTCSMEIRLSDIQDSDAVRMRHTGVLGLCAFISAYPYDIPDFVPDVFEHLGAHLNDPQPIPSTIRKTVGDFKRTHHDNWATHQLKFTEDQLAVLSDLTIPPSYYS